MEFYHLRSFVAVAKTGNLTQAAKRLYTTPPSISAHIKSLEEELNTALFIRSSKGMTLTEKGELLLDKAQITLDSALDLVNHAVESEKEVIGTFRIGLNLSVERVKLIELIHILNEHSPGINLDIQLQSTGSILANIESDALDGGFVYGDTSDYFNVMPISEREITVVAPMSFDTSKIVTQYDLRNYQWITMGNNCPFDDFLKQKLGEGISSVVQTSDDATRLELVEQGLGLSFLDLDEALEAEKAEKVKIIPIINFSTCLHFAVAKSRIKEPVINNLWHAIKIQVAS